MDLTTYAIPAFVVLMALELLSFVLLPDETEQGYATRDTATSLSMGIGSIVANLGWGVLIVASYHWVAELAPVHWAVGWASAAAVFVGWDFLYYWEHRAGHRIRLLWAAHVNHHSSRRYNLSTALRQTWTGIGSLPFGLPLLLLGFSPAMVFTAQSVNLLYQFWIHTERIDRMWRPIEAVMNTPSHHRVHHGSNQGYLDRNYGGVFIVWDRLFRTFTPETERVEYGLTRNIDTYNPLRVAFHEYAAIGRDLRAVRTLRERLTVLLGTPGAAYATVALATARDGQNS
ncbi:sterol desaturase family protein [Streptacidiphilus jiangxiensis]|uniref:Sterol desaturase/sphingolipid hydroxylase, fatty acid hydroxylase superfamily n=1 Tax=Streptacidiphilus jiangxiensis TaxID=235985 RepID=A0A1H7N6K4_STRJI|nr:sterol desaturase family protein [Streptacidiphilus jiangxiensis]SEL18628.1 Sterol desaturase/sphingolipid hydroxylase, fatty acid hydroxylase superfamily [Streptacidiphilus jiangxiensis]